VRNPQLWSPTHPNVYRLATEVRVDGELKDRTIERTGFRYFRMTPEGFYLNGVLTPLRGVAKHQETEERLSAVHDSDLVQDFDLLRNLGVNYLRLPHYPHAALEYTLADDRGIVVWAENGHSNTAPWTETGDAITREMVRQNYNHPSILFWSAGNEAGGRESSEATNRYAAAIKEEDTSRLVTYANNGGFTAGPALDFVATNTYPGWYGGTNWSFEGTARRAHNISETGAGGVISTHCDYAAATHRVDHYEPEEYQQLVAESCCQIAFVDDARAVSLLTWWVFRDFGDRKYKGWFNTKGLLTDDLVKKDAYYLFQSFLHPDLPVVHIASKMYFVRTGDAANGIKVYSNRPELTLTLNGAAAGVRKNGEYRQQPAGRTVRNVFFWNAPLRTGRNLIGVSDGKGYSDAAVIYFYGTGGLPAVEDAAAPIRELKSSNAANPAYLIHMPIQRGWPFYRDLDGTADNRFGEIPEQLNGASWIAAGRMSKPENVTDLSFTIAGGRGAVDLFIMVSGAEPAAWKAAGWRDVGIHAVWRDNDTRLASCSVMRRRCAAGERVSVPGASTDYVVLLRPVRDSRGNDR